MQKEVLLVLDALLCKEIANTSTREIEAVGRVRFVAERIREEDSEVELDEQPSGQDALREALAHLMHEAWAQHTQFSLHGIIKELRYRGIDAKVENKILELLCVREWGRKIDASYEELPEKEKSKDRKWADKILVVLGGELTKKRTLRRSLREKLAALAHEIWSLQLYDTIGEMDREQTARTSMENPCLVTDLECVKEWGRQHETLFSELSEKEKEGWRETADLMLDLFEASSGRREVRTEHIAEVGKANLTLEEGALVLRWMAAGCAVEVSCSLEKGAPEFWLESALQRLLLQYYGEQNRAFRDAAIVHATALKAIRAWRDRKEDNDEQE
jgi:hypothetical protein